MHLEQSVAYALLTLATCTGAVAAYYLLDLEDYFHLTGLLLGALAANLGRRLLVPVDVTNTVLVFADRILFFVWPIGVLALLCATFERERRLLRFVVAPGALLLPTLLLGWPDLFDGHVGLVGQLVSGATGIAALVLLMLRGRRAAFLSPLEMGAFFCGVSEGLVALVGYLNAEAWWPAIIVYCALYLALLILHLRVLWSLRRTHSTSPGSPPI